MQVEWTGLIVSLVSWLLAGRLRARHHQCDLSQHVRPGLGFARPRCLQRRQVRCLLGLFSLSGRTTIRRAPFHPRRAGQMRHPFPRGAPMRHLAPRRNPECHLKSSGESLRVDSRRTDPPRGPAIRCEHTKYCTKGRSIFSRSTENGPAFP